MLSHDAPRGTYLQFDDLHIQVLGSKQFILAMPGKQMKRGELPNITMKESTREAFMIAVDKAQHDNDWYSLLLAEACKKPLE